MTKTKSATVHQLYKERPMASEFGSTPYNKDALYSEAMIRAIDVELPDVAYFTREDLLHLECFAHLATITRYNYVCRAVRYAIDKKWMLSISQTGLILTGRKRAYQQAVTVWEEYIGTVNRLLPYGTTFTVVSVLSRWKSDEHLTENSKRMILRNVMRRLTTEHLIEQVSFNVYQRA